jgi:beta-glucanase (GH16 family)
MRVLALLTAVGLAASFGHADPPDHAEWELTFEDQFEGNALDSEVWESQNSPGGAHRLDGRWPGNNVVEDGVLHQVTRREDSPSGGKDWSSAHIWTREFTQQYGYFEARMRYGRGLNNAFWLWRPSRLFDRPHFEIDVNEGHTPSQIAMNYHHYVYHGNDWRELVSVGGKWEAEQDLSENFHTYAVEWDAERIIYYFDGQPLRVLTNHGAHAPADVRLSTIIHRSTLERQGIPLQEMDGATMSTDWVRVYRKVRDIREPQGLPEPERFTIPKIADTEPRVDADGACRAVLAEDFEAQEALPQGWQIGEGEPAVAEVEGQSVLRLDPREYVVRMLDEPVSGRLRVEFDLHNDTQGENLLLVTVGQFDASDPAARRASYYTGDIGPYIHWKGRYLRYYTEDDGWTRIARWTGGKWQRVRLLLDVERGVFDVYRIEDGEPEFLGSGPFRHRQQAARGIGLRHRGTGDPVLIDNLTVSTIEQ